MSAGDLEARVQQARERHRERLATFQRLTVEHEGLRDELNEGLQDSSSVWDLVGSLFGPEQAGPHLRSLLGRISAVGAPASRALDSAELERKLETAQRRVLRLAQHMDRLELDRKALRRELEQLHEQATDAVADAELARQHGEALREGLDALAGAVVSPKRRRRLDGDEALLEARLQQRELDRRCFLRCEARLQSLLRLHHQFLRMGDSLHANLHSLHEAANGVLEQLDAELLRLASQAQAQDLAREVAQDMEGLRASVARVNRLSTEGAVLLVENLDRLTEEVDLLAPLDPHRLAAEQEVQRSLKGRDDA